MKNWLRKRRTQQTMGELPIRCEVRLQTRRPGFDSWQTLAMTVNSQGVPPSLQATGRMKDSVTGELVEVRARLDVSCW